MAVTKVRGGDQPLELRQILTLRFTTPQAGAPQEGVMLPVENTDMELRRLSSLHLAKRNYRNSVGASDLMIGERGVPGNFTVYIGTWGDGVTNQ